jgi:hypothetical protein
MLSKSTEVFAKSLGLRVTEDNAFGVYANYFLTVSEARNKKTIKFSCYIGNSDDYAEDYLVLNDGIRAIIDKYSITDYEVYENGIRIVSSAPIAALRELTDNVAKLLDDNQIPNSHFCSECGNQFKAGEKKRIVTISRGKDLEKHLLCEKCALTAAEEAEESKVHESKSDAGQATEVNEKANSKSSAVLYSLLAGLLPSVIYIALFFLLGINGRGEVANYLACLVGLLIGGVVFWVYKSKAGKVSSRGMITVCGISAGLLVFSHFFGCLLGLAKTFNSTFGVSYSTFGAKFGSFISMLFTDSIYLKFLVLGFLIGLCAALIAIIGLYTFGSKQEEEKRKVKVTIQTIK